MLDQHLKTNSQNESKRCTNSRLGKIKESRKRESLKSRRRRRKWSRRGFLKKVTVVPFVVSFISFHFLHSLVCGNRVGKLIIREHIYMIDRRRFRTEFYYWIGILLVDSRLW